jgi:DNA-binding transcriptional LysR family regulator
MQRPMFTLDQLTSFIAVAEELNFRRAAERLNMTQPPLTKQIQKLEKSTGVELFFRNKRKVEITPAGTAFLKDARRLLTLATVAPIDAQRVAAGSRGLVRIGFTASASFSILGPFLDEVKNWIPDVDLDLNELNTVAQLHRLQARELDLAIARPPFDTEIYDSQLLFRETLMLAVPAGHSLTGLGRDVVPADLRSQPLIMYSPDQAQYFYNLTVRMLPFGHAIVAHTVSQVLTMVCLVAANKGLAIVPESAAVLGIEGVDYLPLAQAGEEPVELHLIWDRGSENPALARLLASLQM